MKQMDKDQIWKRNEDGTMELIEEIKVEREVEENFSNEEYFIDLDFRLSMIELGL